MMKTFTALLLAGTMAAGLAACSDKTSTTTTTNSTTMTATDAAAVPDRVRGTLTAVGPNSVTVQTYDGKSVEVALNDKTGVAWVLPSSLDTLKQGDFIGTATTGPDTALKAVEVVIFPEAMRGTGEGHYGWDTPAVVQASAGDSDAANGMANGADQNSGMTNGTVSAMTNGTVTKTGGAQNSGMTNGTVSNSNSVAGEQQLTVSYKGGSAQVAVPKGTPIVRFDPADKAILTNGQKVFVLATTGADGKLTAKSVAAGKDGLMPPM